MNTQAPTSTQHQAASATAHYFASKTRKYVVISSDARPIGTTVDVSSKAQARQVAADNHAQPWNF